MNIETDQPTLDELESSFRFNDAVLRSLILLRDEAVTEPSFLIRAGQSEAEAEKPDDDDIEEEDEIVLAEDEALVIDINPAVVEA
jgi:small subunit ribosomal protein S6